MHGDEFLVYNVHSLVHLAADVSEHRTLDVCSAFAFENYTQHLKKLIRSGNNPIVQINKRLGESSADKLPQKPIRKDIDIKKPNNSFIFNNSCLEVIDTSNDFDEEGNPMFICPVYSKPSVLFGNPCDSGLVGTYRVNLRQVTVKQISSKCLEHKAIMIQLKSFLWHSYILCSLCHCLSSWYDMFFSIYYATLMLLKHSAVIVT